MVSTSTPTESALLLVVPAAEPAVGRHRLDHDRAARVGVPAHMTVAYPFTPIELLDDGDVSALLELCGGEPAFQITFSATAGAAGRRPFGGRTALLLSGCTVTVGNSHRDDGGRGG